MLKHGNKKVNSGMRKIEKYLVEHGSITVDEAYKNFGIYTLSDTIRILEEEGRKIKRTKEGKKTRYWLVYDVVAPAEPEPKEYWAIIGFYKSTSGAISVRLDQTLFTSEEEADEYGSIAKDNDPEMYAYDVMQMVKFVKEK